jgi:hypothetical protein
VEAAAPKRICANSIDQYEGLGVDVQLGRAKNVLCPLWVICRHCGLHHQCPLCALKRTSFNAVSMSAKCQKQTPPTGRPDEASLVCRHVHDTKQPGPDVANVGKK